MKPQLIVSNEIKIAIDIPVPEKRTTHYPWAGMDVGHSIFVPGRIACNILSAANDWAKRNRPEWKFTCRTVTESGVKGARVWRTA